MSEKYVFVKDWERGDSVFKQGDVVTRCRLVTYGLCSYDAHATGIGHMAMTLDSDGGYPFFTVPINVIEPLAEPPCDGGQGND